MHEIIFQCTQVARRLQADEVVAGQRFQQLAVLGQHDQQRGRRQRRVQKKADAVLYPPLAEHRGHGNQMIVVHPHDIVRLQQRDQVIGKPRVGAHIAVQMAALIIDHVQAKMQQRPQRAVGESRVKLVVILTRKVERGVVDRLVADLVEPFVAGYLAAPAEPQAAVLLQRGLHGRGQPAGRGFPGQRDAVGNHHQAT
jgi:hypothetical protein